MRPGLILLGLLLTMAMPALAQSQHAQWYAGAGVGRLFTEFEPNYTFVLGGSPQQFFNDADGLQVEAVVGRHHQLSDRVSFAYQGAFSANNFQWSLSIPEEPADLRYSLPQSFVASAMPEVRVAGIVSVFGAIGGGAGHVREVKTSPSSSTYNVDTWRPIISLGGGVKVKAGTRSSLYVDLRAIRYSGFEFDTFNSAQVHVEHVQDTPRAHGVVVGFVTAF
jgi:opacity protein-like surface antigen